MLRKTNRKKKTEKSEKHQIWTFSLFNVYFIYVMYVLRLIMNETCQRSYRQTISEIKKEKRKKVQPRRML